MKIVLFMLISLLLTVSVVSAHGDDFETAKQLIDSGTACDELTDDQLEHMGEYYMEQMHPGQSHELMHKMMGLEEGSNAEIQFHINMAKVLYCNESNQGMMNYAGMMGGMGMMNMIQGMMGNWNWSGFGWGIWSTLSLILVIGLITLVYLLIMKTWKELSQRRK